jgi:cold shock CspA family protein
MQVPLRIASHHYELPPEAEELIRERAAWLERFYPGLIGCAVTIEGAGAHHRTGGPIEVHLDLRVPGADPLLINRQAGGEIEVALRETFDAARRRLEDLAREQRGQVKAHAEPLRGRVAQLLPDAPFGFLLADGDEHRVYFHANAVLPPGFGALAVGDPVRFVEEQGAEGPQASTVEVI